MGIESSAFSLMGEMTEIGVNLQLAINGLNDWVGGTERILKNQWLLNLSVQSWKCGTMQICKGGREGACCNRCLQMALIIAGLGRRKTT